MMKRLTFLFAVFCLAHSQRPMYAGTINRHYPQALPQYIQEQAATMSSSLGTIGNRFDEGGSSGSSSSFASSASTTSTIPPDLPVDALGDVGLIERIKTWPKEKQPFWYLNWQQIQENRGDTRFKERVQPTDTFRAGTTLPTRKPPSTFDPYSSRDFVDGYY